MLIQRISIIPKICFFIILFVSVLRANEPNQIKDQFSIYLLKDKNQNLMEAQTLNLDNIVLVDTPLITIDQLKYYKWKTHEFSFKDSLHNPLSKYDEAMVPLDGLPFVVIANDERIYVGALWNPGSSIRPIYYSIDMIPIWIKKNYVKIRRYDKTRNENDQRSDTRIYNVLKSAGILIK